jgi:hypothetical protein
MCLTQRGKIGAIQANERERMRAGLRLGLVFAAAGLWLAQAPALAQSTPPAATNTAAPETVGPRELQNFSLQGTVTRPAEPTPAPRGTATRAAPTRDTANAPAQAVADRPTRIAGSTPHRAAERATPPSFTAAANPRASTPPPPIADDSSAPAVASTSLPITPVQSPATLAPEQGFSLWPWLLAALALGAGAAFVLWRRNSRESYAGGPQADAFVAPEPAPQPKPPAPSQPQPVGFVSSRMRPWIEIAFQPTRCVVEEQGVTFEFELELYNSGNAPARDVLLAVNMFNASPTQDQEIRSFFQANGQADRLPLLPPLQRISLRPQFGLPLDQIRMLEAGGRRVFVPLIAFNAVYGWGGGAGQTAAAYLVGRDTKSDKLAPFRADLGRRVFRGLGSRPLPLSVRD